jgi:hypothetical protein
LFVPGPEGILFSWPCLWAVSCTTALFFGYWLGRSNERWRRKDAGGAPAQDAAKSEVQDGPE